MSDREALSIPDFDDDLTDFAPRGAKTRDQRLLVANSQVVSNAATTRRSIDAVSGFPSREATVDGQLNLKGPQHVLDRFKTICKADRRSYYNMLEILMDFYEAKERGPE